MVLSNMAAQSILLSLLSFHVIFSIAAGQQCHEGWHYHAGSCYGFGESQVAWGDAQELCIAFNGKLAEVETEEENTFLKNIVKNKQALITWLGGTDIFEEGVWEWVSTGQPIYPFLDWAPNQPDSGRAEDCLTFYASVGYRWNDYSCDNAANFLCEADYSDDIVAQVDTWKDLKLIAWDRKTCHNFVDRRPMLLENLKDHWTSS